VILRFEGKTFPDERALRRAITVKKPGEQVNFSVWHNGQEIDTKVTLEPWPKSIWERNAALPSLHVTVPPHLGLTVSQLTDALRASNEITADTKGVLVTEVEPGSEAEQQGVTVGDLVLQVGPNQVRSPEEFWSEVDRLHGESRRFLLLLLLSTFQPVPGDQFPGAKWIALRIGAD
jgi:serine protease Do